MKKITLLILSLVLIFSLVGCGTTTNLSDTEDPTVSSSETESVIKDSLETLAEGLSSAFETLEETTEAVKDTVTAPTEESSESVAEPEPGPAPEPTSEPEQQSETLSDPIVEIENPKKENNFKETTYSYEYGKLVNDFTVDISTKLTDKNQNIIFSPFSIYTALAASTNGSYVDNIARQEILKALKIDSDISYKNLGNTFSKFNKQLESKKSTFTVANSIWLDDSVKSEGSKEYVDNLEKYFNSEYFSTNLQDAKTKDTINEWISTKTNDLIKSVSVNPTDETIMYLINTIYFKGAWTDVFSERATTKEEFKGTKETKEVDMMKKYDTSKDYYENDVLHAISLNYVGNDYSMEIYIPKDKNTYIGDIINTVDFNNVTFSRQLLNISVPKFEVEYTLKVKEILNQLGIKTAFQSGTDSFEYLGDKIYISDVSHKAKIVVNEEGTEAAAVTVMEQALGSAFNPNKPTPIEFHADCPFIYVIRHNPTGTIIFYGVNNNL